MTPPDPPIIFTTSASSSSLSAEVMADLSASSSSSTKTATPLTTSTIASSTISSSQPPQELPQELSREPLTSFVRRNRASSLSFDLAPFRLLLSSLQDNTVSPPTSHTYNKQEISHALGALVEHVDGLTARLHASLAKQLDTDHQLKVARSNLFLVESNMEMMEEAMRRGGEFGHAIVAQTNRRSAPPKSHSLNNSSASARSSPVPSAAADRSSTELSSPNSMAFPSEARTTPTTTANASSGGGWFNRQSKRLGFSPAASSTALNQTDNRPDGYAPAPAEEQTPRTEGSSGESGSPSRLVARPPHAGSSRSFNSSTPNLGLGFGNLPLSPGASTVSLSAAGDSQAGTTSQMDALRQTLTAERTQLVSLRTELAELKSSKTALEEELENLSQALFEEANKMVADERNSRLAMEDEVRDEKEQKVMLKEALRLVEEDCERLRDLVSRLEEQQDSRSRAKRSSTSTSSVSALPNTAATRSRTPSPDRSSTSSIYSLHRPPSPVSDANVNSDLSQRNHNGDQNGDDDDDDDVEQSIDPDLSAQTVHVVNIPSRSEHDVDSASGSAIRSSSKPRSRSGSESSLGSFKSAADVGAISTATSASTTPAPVGGQTPTSEEIAGAHVIDLVQEMDDPWRT